MSYSFSHSSKRLILPHIEILTDILSQKVENQWPGYSVPIAASTKQLLYASITDHKIWSHDNKRQRVGKPALMSCTGLHLLKNT